jgi:uncharacterized cysteine cluster protein YcgN (CxxCxxCC family)/peptidoglycan hydrolase CwlO-like protein
MLPISQLLECTVGCNSPELFTAFGDTIFIPVDNGVVIVEEDRQRHWMPIGPGKYSIDQIAISSSGILCVVERRLQVTLHFFDAATLQLLSAVETDLRVGVASIVFSAKGDELYVLSTVPCALVSVFRCKTSGCDYVAAGKIDLPRTAVPLSVLAVDTPEKSAKFAVLYRDGIRGFSQRSTEFNFEMTFVLAATIEAAGAAGSDSLCYATSEGLLCTYSYETRVQREVCVLPLSAKPTALSVEGITAFVSFSTGELCAVNMSDGSVLSTPHLPYVGPIQKVVATASGKLFVSSDKGLFDMTMTPPHGGKMAAQLVKGWRTSGTLRCLSSADASRGVWVLRDGGFLVYRKGKLTEVLTGVVESKAIDACLLDSSRILILYDDAVLRCFDIVNGEELWHHQCAECLPQLVESDGCGNVACCGVDTIRFLTCAKEAKVADCGIVHATLLASIRLARWIPSEASLLAICENGDVFLVDQPTEGSAETVHAAEVLVKNAWRLELPVTDALICHATAEVLNLFAHSADHDSKVYALDRRYEGETKVSRPLFVLGDHGSGGGCLIRLNQSSVLSCGRDGHIVARDLTPYQLQLPPAPPSREKRKPLWVCAVRSSFRGGVVTAAAFEGGTKLLCSGSDTILQCLSLRADNSDAATWTEPTWEAVGAVDAFTGEEEAFGAANRAASPERETLLVELDRVREAWAKVMQEKDDDVPIEALMTEEERAAFTVECEKAVHEMQEQQYYHSLLNDYLQDMIKRRCCDSMEVPRMKVVSMNDGDLQVHNFHLSRTTVKESALSRKALFLRHLQKRIRGGHKTSISVASAPQDASVVDESDRTSSEYSAAMLDEADVYTLSRIVVQSFLVKGWKLAVKERFNEQFKELQETKRNVGAQMEERMLRCVAISKQLGELPAELYTPHVDPEEDPGSLFRVEDRELSAEAQALIVPSECVAVVSAANEEALHLWMDGLEKEVERLVIEVPQPDFADESRDTFVPPEERTEEQLRAFEDYTKKLKEEEERVNAKKDALRTEFQSLQEKNRQSATKLDEYLKDIQQSRINAVEQVDEAELRLALLFGHRLRTLASHRQYRLCKPQIESLRDELVGAQSWLVQQKRIFAAAQSRRNDVVSEMRNYAASASTSYPFNDGAAGDKLHRRFARWLRRFEDGKAPMPDVNASLAECDAEQWSAFCAHCEAVARIQDTVREADSAVQHADEEVVEATRHCDSIEERIAALEKEMQTVYNSSVKGSLDVPLVCRLHQGQIQDESATTCTAFSAFNLRWRSDITQYNDLILASDAESRTLLEKIAERRKLMKRLDWEKDKLQYDAGTLQMELRQLHTLRVTRQMQEYINGDAGVSEEKQLASIQRHMQLVETNMSRKVEDLKTVARRLRKQIADRATENVIVGNQVGEVSSTVRDSAAVYQLIDARADGTSTYLARAREIFQTSELEELARSQQEELVRLKREVDRLRERTFPSFAVVSKQTR